MNVGQVVFVTRLHHFGLRFAAKLLTIEGIDGQTVELQATQAIRQRIVVGGDQAPSAQVTFLMAWNEKIAVPRAPTHSPL